MGKAFIGPFRVEAVDEVVIHTDGTAFISLRDANGNVIGLTADRAILLQLQSAATDVPLTHSPVPLRHALR